MRFFLLLLGLLLLGGAAAGVAWYLTRGTPAPPPPPAEEELTPDPPPPDPRLTFPTRFRNVRPEVGYAGDAACARCHAAIDRSYHAHPMGRSAFRGHAAPPEELGAAANNSFRSGPYELKVERTPAGFTHRVSAKDAAGGPLPDYAVAADLTIGSGTRGRSYLSVEGGAVWQSPVSWYSSRGKWDLSPGFDLGNGGRWPINNECLFCHVDRAEPVAGSVNRYRGPVPLGQAAIGCERCHGPGQLHVAERSGGAAPAGADTSIVNPRHLPPDLKAAVCEQCHAGQERVDRPGRNVFEFRPGLPLEQFVTVFVRHPDFAAAHHSTGQFEQMEASRCFAGSAGRMGCTTCHDPHAAPAPEARDKFYRDRCLTCHESKGCSAPPADRRAKGDGCVTCHMPRAGSVNIVHASATDHHIPRRPAGETAPPRRPAPGPGAVPLVAFRTGRHAPPEAERERDLGVALARLAFKVPPDAAGTRRAVAELASGRLTRSLELRRGDADAWAALAVARGVEGDPPERLRAAAAAARLAPDSEVALAELAEASLATGKFDDAVAAASSLIRMTPTTLEPYLMRASAYAAIGDWARSEDDCRAALRVQPLHPQARVMLAACRHHRGDPEGGRREADTAAGLATSPRQRSALLEWYARQTR